MKNERAVHRTVMTSDKYEVYHIKGDYPKEVALHHHDFYEVYFFCSGTVEYIVENRHYILKPGDVLLIRPQEMHQPIFEQDHESYERYVLWINRRFLQKLTYSAKNLTDCFYAIGEEHTNLLRPAESALQQLHYQLDQLLQEMENKDRFQDMNALCYLVQILIALNRITVRRGGSTPSEASPMYRVLEYINEHYADNLTLDDLGERFFISKYHLSREFGRLTGTSVHKYITQRRLLKAQQLISSGISPAAAYPQCGFGDYSTFYRAFKAEFGISPKSYGSSIRSMQNVGREAGGLMRQIDDISTEQPE